MTWIALFDHEARRFNPRGLGAAASAPLLVDRNPEALLPRGSLLIELRLPETTRPRYLVHYDSGDGQQLRLSLQAIPGGGLTLILDHGGEVVHRTINDSDLGRCDRLRITYAWDAPERMGWLALERPDQDSLRLDPLRNPRPLSIGELCELTGQGRECYIAPDIEYIAVSNKVEPVGPMPGLTLNSPIATPGGYRFVKELRPGDTVLTADGRVEPVLARVDRQVPARGSLRPVHLRAPFFGLQQDIAVAPSLKIVVSGSAVEYLFGHESVLAPAGHFAGGFIGHNEPERALVTYTQLLLPDHATLLAAGAPVESLFIGRLVRNPQRLGVSVLANMPRGQIPDHGKQTHPVLKAFEATVLAERRVA